MNHPQEVSYTRAQLIEFITVHQLGGATLRPVMVEDYLDQAPHQCDAGSSLLPANTVFVPNDKKGREVIFWYCSVCGSTRIYEPSLK